ncbi:MAG: SAF domain-containing protein [Microbacteriaceae bacterium]
MPEQMPGIRRRRAFWVDPRFLIGVGLVLASVAGVYGIVAGADRSTVVLAARTPLTAGDTVQASDLVPTQVRLAGSDRLYLTRDTLPTEGAVVTRTIAAGELVPTSAVGAATSPAQTSIVVTVHGQLAGSIKPGSVVDIWSAAALEHARFGPPTVVVDSATVVRLVEGDRMLGDRTGIGVEVLVPKKKVAAVLEAAANGNAISVVPDTTPLGGTP